MYLGTKSSDPFYPTSRVDALINAAYKELVADVQQTDPDYLLVSDTIEADSAESHTYDLGAQLPTLARLIEVRLTDQDGTLLIRVREDERTRYSGAIYSLSGYDHDATLTTGDGVTAGSDLFIKYLPHPSDLSDPADSPDAVPREYHDLIALKAAITGYALGGEQFAPRDLIALAQDRHAQLIQHLYRRAEDPYIRRLDVMKEA